MGQLSGMAQLGPLLRASQDYSQGMDYAAFSSGSSAGEEFTPKHMQVVGRTYFLLSGGQGPCIFAGFGYRLPSVPSHLSQPLATCFSPTWPLTS